MAIPSKPHTAAEYMNFIRERCEKGAVITIGQDFVAVGGKKLWSIRGAGVNCSGWLSFTEAMERWIDAVEYADEHLS